MSEKSIIDFVRPAVRAMQPYQGGKPKDQVRRAFGIENPTKLASNECPYPTSLAVRRAIATQAMEVNTYPDGSGFALVQLLARKHSVQPEQITLGNGSNELLELLVLAFTDSSRGDCLLTGKHAFLVYRLLATTHGIGYVECDLQEWRVDLHALAAAMDERVRLVCIANPANPTGTAVDNAELEQYIAQVPPTTLVVLDQAYADFHPAADAALEWMEKYPNLVITRTFSKASGLAGLRIGYLLASAHITDLLNRVRQPFNVNSLAQAAAIAVTQDRETLQRTIANNLLYRQKLQTLCNSLQLAYLPSEANFLTIDCVTEVKAARWAKQLLMQGIIVRSLVDYAMPSMLRITVGTPEQMEQLFAAMRKLVL